LLAVAVVALFAFFGSYLLLKLVNVFSPLRASPQAEDAGLDLSEHGEEAYQLDSVYRRKQNLTSPFFFSSQLLRTGKRVVQN